MGRLSGPSLHFGRVLLGYPAAAVAASAASVFFWSLFQLFAEFGASSFSPTHALAALVFAVLILFVLIFVFALPGFVLALLLIRYVRFRSWASFVCLGALNGALGVALMSALPDSDECHISGAICFPDFSPQFLLWSMLAGMLAGVVFRRVSIGFGS